MKHMFVILSLMVVSLTTNASILKYVNCEYGPDKQIKNSIQMDLSGKKLSNISIDANGWNSSVGLVGSAFDGPVPSVVTESDLSVNYVDSTQNVIKIKASGKGFKWNGTISIAIPAPRADNYQPNTKLDKVLEGKFKVRCYRELDDIG